MAKLFLSNINLNKNELQNAKVHVLASAPGTPAAGQIYYNSGDGNLYVYDGIQSQWIDLTSQGTTAPNATTGAVGLIQLAGDLGGAGTTATVPVISAGAIDAGKIAGSLKPSGTAAAGTEALRALGTTASTALAGNTTLNAITAPTASVSLNSQKITSLADGTATTDAATWGQVQALVQGIAWKESVRVASTANVTVATPGTAIDGVTLANGDRVLLKNQTTGSENGIYAFNGSGSALTRTADADSTTDIESAAVFIEEGTANANSLWTMTTEAVTIGTTAQTWVQFNAAGDIIAGNGLTKTGTTLDVVGTANRISVAADSIDISSAYVGQATITTLGTITTGTWTGTTIALLNGGTGATTAAGARTNLGAAGLFNGTITGDGSTTTFTVTHNLNNRQPVVRVWDQSTGNPNTVVETDVSSTGVNTVTVGFATAPLNTVVYYVTCVG